jgi:diguanylate cyclase (GGDEF)-like protein
MVVARKDSKREALQAIHADEILRGLSEALQEGLAILRIVDDEEGIPTDYLILSCNDSFASLTGVDRAKAEGALGSIAFSRNPPPALRRFAAVASSRKADRFGFHDDATDLDLLCHAFSPSKGHVGVVLSDISALKLRPAPLRGTEEQLQEEIEYLSLHDPTTGLFNRKHFERETKRLAATERRPVAIVMGDLNGLRITNDVFGHDLGDRLLCEVADVLRECAPKDASVFRLGGDKYAVLLPGRDAAETAVLVECIRTRSGLVHAGSLPVSISLGTAVWDRHGKRFEECIRDAENEMFRTKMEENKIFRTSLLESIKGLLFDKCLESDRHTERIAACCQRIADAMGLPEKDKNDLEMLAMVHDIGKIAVKETIVFKPTDLDEAEWLEMKRHTEVGYRIAQATPELFHIAEAILSHHERWDGTGYPQGASGLNIPRLARILTVADSFDAMTNYRPFREALSIEEAAEEIRRGIGYQFDPHIAEIFLKKVVSPLSDIQE